MIDWILSVGTTIIFASIISIIIPEGKMNSYIKSILSILVILVIIKPMLTTTINDYDFDKILNQDVVVLQDDFLNYTNDKKIQNIIKKCKTIINEIGIENPVVNIDYFVEENNQITIKEAKINLRNSVIISDKEHIDIIEDVKTVISDYLNIASDKVIIYE